MRFSGHPEVALETTSPAKKPVAIYPEFEPPFLLSRTYVTLQPANVVIEDVLPKLPDLYVPPIVTSTPT